MDEPAEPADEPSPTEPGAPPRRRLLELAVLAGALVIAAGVAAFLFLSTGDDGPAGPEDVTRNLYDAAEAGDSTGFAALLEPGLRDDPARDLIPFGSSAGAVAVGPASRVELSNLNVRKINEEAGWATVSARGSVRINGEQSTVQETIYLRRVGAIWVVSNESRFLEAFGGGGGGRTPEASAGLGPLEPNRPKVGERAPDFALVDARDPATVRKLSDFRGQAVILNWYASWCTPCKVEIPEFQEALDAVGPSLTVLGVNYLETAGRATGILDIFKTNYPAVLDSDGRVADHYRVGPGIPVTFFIDKEGVLQATRFGQIRREDLPGLLAQVGVTYTPKD